MLAATVMAPVAVAWLCAATTGDRLLDTLKRNHISQNLVNQAGTDELNIIVPEVKEENILHLYLLVRVAIRPLRADHRQLVATLTL